VIERCVDAVPRPQAPMTELQGLIGVSKLVGVAVRQDMQRTGVGTELVWLAEQMLRRCGSYIVMYGSCSDEVTPSTSGLASRLSHKSTQSTCGSCLGSP
jgi:hypothetical protein